MRLENKYKPTRCSDTSIYVCVVSVVSIVSVVSVVSVYVNNNTPDIIQHDTYEI